MTWNMEEIINKAGEIATEAGSKALSKLEEFGHRFAVYSNNTAVDKIYDVCGIAGVVFKDKRTKFYKAYSAYIKSVEPNIGDINNFYHDGGLHRQEYTINRAQAEAVADYLNKNFNAKVKARAWVD